MPNILQIIFLIVLIIIFSGHFESV